MFFRGRHWPSSSELRLTWSAQPSRPRRASRAFSEPRLRPASTNSTPPTNPAPSAASPRDCSTCPARRTSSPPPSAKTSPKAAPSCDGSSGARWVEGKNGRENCTVQGVRGGREQQCGPLFSFSCCVPLLSPVSHTVSAKRQTI